MIEKLILRKEIVFIFIFLYSSLTLEAEKSRFEKLELFNKVLFLVESQYYRKVHIDKLIDNSIKGLMGGLDPHSAYLGKESFQKVKEDTSGEFGGIGIEVTQKDGIIYVVTPLEGGPGQRAGLRARDKIVEIEHESTLGMTLEDAVTKMKGKENTSINLGILRDGVQGIKYFKVRREKIKFRPIKGHLLKDEFILLKLSQFQEKSGSYIRKELKKLKKKIKKDKVVRGIILDLRSNPGGLLDEAVEVSSIFLEKGVVVSTEGRAGKHKEVKFVTKAGDKELSVPMAVLVNGSSASASEIVAGALQDHKRAIIMGQRSFGKGSVQSIVKIDDENGVKLTIAQYYTPKGRMIQARGIIPDIELDDFGPSWYEKSRRITNFMREQDLRNHLTATVETDEERKLRSEYEKDQRKRRAEMIQLRREKLKKQKDKEDDIFKKYNPNRDYQVIQAINYLKAQRVFADFQVEKKK